MLGEHDAGNWLDYVIGSDEPADQQLLKDYLAHHWAYAQTMQWIDNVASKKGLIDEAFTSFDEQERASQSFEERVIQRGKARADAGFQPADPMTVAAWKAGLAKITSKGARYDGSDMSTQSWA